MIDALRCTNIIAVFIDADFSFQSNLLRYVFWVSYIDRLLHSNSNQSEVIQLDWMMMTQGLSGLLKKCLISIKNKKNPDIKTDSGVFG